jgi:indolepyruvate ferredoxin oxidoreductase beta subunit
MGHRADRAETPRRESRMNAARTLNVVIGALGGEGGGVLKDWIVATAHAADLPVQATSIPGVAQRTGATTYYVEIFPEKRTSLSGREPLMCLAPTPGQVDVLLFSELVETARAVQLGLVSDRTTVIASTHRVYLTAEKMQMADGRFAPDKAVTAIRGAAARAILFDMEAETVAAGTVISAVMFGALIGAGVLPLPRALAEAAIRAGGRGVEASLKGFAAGFERAAAGGASPAARGERPLPRVDAPTGLLQGLSPEVHDIVALGIARANEYQDTDYAKLYVERVRRVHEADRKRGGGPAFMTTRETARFLALWMCYEDIARVADMKIRPERFDGIRREAGIDQAPAIRVIEFFKPGYDEVADLLPKSLAERVRRHAKRKGRQAIFENGLHVETTSFSGALKLRALAGMRRFRRGSSRFATEQALIERWIAAIVAAPHAGLAIEIALTGRLIKGYSETHVRAKENFTRILETLIEGNRIADPAERARAIRSAREAALAAPDGKPLDAALAPHGVAPRAPKPVPITFHPRARNR